MLTGEIPVGHVKPPSTLAEGLPKSLDDVVLRCIEPKAEDRFADVAALRAALDKALAPPTPAQPSAAPDVESAAEPPTERRPGPSRSRTGTCPFCGALTDLGLDHCVHCGGALRRTSETPAHSTDTDTCPNCGAAIRPSDIICVACNTNLITGKKIGGREPSASSPDAPRRRTLILIAAAAVAILLIVLVAAAFLRGDSDGSSALAPGTTRTVDLGGGVNMELVWIPPGTFMMGSPADEEGSSDSEGPPHRVMLTKGFWMGKYEVTQAQWEAVMDGRNPSYFQGGKNLPVERVSWNDCQEFIEKLNGRTGAGFRLPTEAEWEYACRAGTTTPFHFGETISTSQANYDGNYVYGNGRKGEFRRKTTPVGSFPANPWGLHDMHGNVGEWCLDWFREDYYADSPNRNPEGPPWGEGRVMRGGAWELAPPECTSADRGAEEPTGSRDALGFRVVSGSAR
ncbi:MAG: SUMF1/EgtB/PvdO family nonheme iron enzyme [Candidatus Hydrogenedentes bacterium]|nr:SUMF1/EgtB/PvdO family nonheme iron enzyme [Candidatus Hydrogenedentota bacterium]